MASKFVLMLCAAAVFTVAVAMPAAEPSAPAAPVANASPNEDMKTAETHIPFALNLGFGGIARTYMPIGYRGLGIDMSLNPYHNLFGYAVDYPYYY